MALMFVARKFAYRASSAMLSRVTSSPEAGPTWVSGIPGVPGAVLIPDPTAGLRERKKVATRRALGMAAMRLAVERGLDNVLVEDIAEAAGVSARTFNNYFASKHEAICALGFDRAMRVGAALRERPPGEPLWDAIVAAVMSEYGSADRALGEDWMTGVRLVTSEPALRGEYLKVQAMTQYSLAEAIGLRMGFKHGANMFPRIMAAAVTSAVQAAMERWLHADPPAEIAPLIRRSLQQLADGMREVLPLR